MKTDRSRPCYRDSPPPSLALALVRAPVLSPSPYRHPHCPEAIHQLPVRPPASASAPAPAQALVVALVARATALPASASSSAPAVHRRPPRRTRTLRCRQSDSIDRPYCAAG